MKPLRLQTLAMQVIRITDLQAPVLHPYLTLKRPKEHHKQGLFVAEGRLVVERLLQAPAFPVRSVLTMPQWLERLEVLLKDRASVPVYVAERKEIQEIVGFSYHAGLLALAECPPVPTLAEALRGAPAASTWVALDALSHAENVGVMTRNAAALGADGLIVGPTSASPFLRRAVRNSLGGIFALKVVSSQNLAKTLCELKTQYGFGVVGADADSGVPLEEFQFEPRTCLVLGHEEHGLTPSVRDACQACVCIPMEGGLDSLNVAAAGAILLHEVRRQRLR